MSDTCHYDIAQNGRYRTISLTLRVISYIPAGVSPAWVPPCLPPDSRRDTPAPGLAGGRLSSSDRGMEGQVEHIVMEHIVMEHIVMEHIVMEHIVMEHIVVEHIVVEHSGVFQHITLQ